MIKRNDAFWRKKWSKQITSSSSSPVTTSTYRYRCSNLSWPFLTYPSRYKKKKRKEKQKLSFNRCCFPDPDSVKHRLIWFWLLFFLCNVLLYCTSHHRWGGVGGWVVVVVVDLLMSHGLWRYSLCTNTSLQEFEQVWDQIWSEMRSSRDFIGEQYSRVQVQYKRCDILLKSCMIWYSYSLMMMFSGAPLLWII